MLKLKTKQKLGLSRGGNLPLILSAVRKYISELEEENRTLKLQLATRVTKSTKEKIC